MDMPLPPRPAPVLDRIAQALGCAPGDFLGPPETRPLAGAVELLRLWEATDADAGRERILACARVVAARRDRPARPGR